MEPLEPATVEHMKTELEFPDFHAGDALHPALRKYMEEGLKCPVAVMGHASEARLLYCMSIFRVHVQWHI